MDNDFPPPNQPPRDPVPQPPPASPPPPLPPLLAPPVAARKPPAGRGWRIATFVLAGLLILTLLGSFVSSFFQIFGAMESLPGESRLMEVTLERNHASDKIAVIP